MSNETLSTDAIIHDPNATRSEKLDRLNDMGYELKRFATRNETSADEVEHQAAEIKAAKARVEKEG
ncbi:hypothetical protein E2A64_02640 [Pseudohoeflea suaedae]|uniref:Uncharacterized protein n=1 Tax=Pseudohoeflea suaedae TaxID=877384 RepID=A0A4R5PM34_9HYPH|nr:hypothetical protein [Pseudohoeflea suaedae]TDH38044.1 hypothetical protein E2A64_02640 [Pseudohoeflea suaedae]